MKRNHINRGQKATLMIDGRIVLTESSRAFSGTRMAKLVHNVADIELQEHGNSGTDASNYSRDSLCFFGHARFKILQLKNKLLDILLQKLFLRHKPSPNHYIVCLYIENDVYPTAEHSPAPHEI